MIKNVKIIVQQKHKPNLLCHSCKKSVWNQSHLMYCPALLGSNQLIIYIPNYEDVFDDNNMEKECFIARIMMETLQHKKEIDIPKL